MRKKTPVTEAERDQVQALAAQGLSRTKIAQELGMTPTRVESICSRYGIKTHGKHRKSLND